MVTQAVWRSARACAFAQTGDIVKAERLAREAVELANGTDFLDLQAGSHLSLAEVLRLAHRSDEAEPLVERARALYERKGNVVAVAKTATLAEPVR